MKDTLPSASPLFLREDEVRRGIELLHFGHVSMMASIEDVLSNHGLGQAHHRALYFIGRQDDQTVGAILSLLGITKQSLGRVLQDLIDHGFMETRAGIRDRRQKLLRLTPKGREIEAELFARQRERMGAAYAQAGQGPVTGFWRVLEGLLEPEQLRRLMTLQIKR
ncbi:MAG TPA: MarR family transcriptional regulator [Sphingobium sp.]|uniref:MarR family winged helix-turn-helix transcriptional regulator n=1 Tax=Sphingobium sp. TaxID=1912891 RepID=UPI002ED2DA81